MVWRSSWRLGGEETKEETEQMVVCLLAKRKKVEYVITLRIVAALVQEAIERAWLRSWKLEDAGRRLCAVAIK